MQSNIETTVNARSLNGKALHISTKPAQKPDAKSTAGVRVARGAKRVTQKPETRGSLMRAVNSVLHRIETHAATEHGEPGYGRFRRFASAEVTNLCGDMIEGNGRFLFTQDADAMIDAALAGGVTFDRRTEMVPNSETMKRVFTMRYELHSGANVVADAFARAYRLDPKEIDKALTRRFGKLDFEPRRYVQLPLNGDATISDHFEVLPETRSELPSKRVSDERDYYRARYNEQFERART